MKRDWAIIRILAIALSKSISAQAKDLCLENLSIDYGITAVNQHLRLMVENKIIDRIQPFYLEEVNSIKTQINLASEWEQRVSLLRNENVWAKVLEMAGDEYGVVICSSSVLIELLLLGV